MAYMNQEKKAVIAAELKKVMPKGWKYSLAVHNHSTIVCTIRSAPVDLLAEMREVREEEARLQGNDACPIDGYADVNPYRADCQFKESKEVIGSILSAMNTGNHNRSDSMTDYYDVGFYVDLNIGAWNKPFVVYAECEA